MTPVPDCRCADVERVVGDAASPYARGHLRLQTVAPDARSATWVCPTTGWRWLETYFSTWQPDEPTARLDRLDRAPAQPAVRRTRRIPWRPAMVVLAAALGLATLSDRIVT